jgi:hypothetical protein
MFHPDYPTKLECGCDCAGIMQQNKEAAEQFEKYAKAVGRARKLHADALRTMSLSASGALLRSTWDDANWSDDEDRPRLCGKRTGRGKLFTSYMVLEGVGDYWLSVNRRGLDGYGGNVGLTWWDGYRTRRSKGVGSPMTFQTPGEAKAWAVRKMVELWRKRIDLSLSEVEGRNKAVNEFGDVIDLT